MSETQTKVALITGAAKRIGAQLTRSFHEQGYNILLHCHQSLKEAERLASELNDQREGSVEIVTFDLRDTRFNSFADDCLNKFGRIDTLINNASLFFPTSLDALTLTEYDDLMAVNLRAPLFLARQFASSMNGGSIVNIIDIYGDRPLKHYGVYSVTKAALVMLTKSLALELAPDVRVNGISPGAILWPENEAEMTGLTKAQLLKKIPMGTLGTPLDIARTALFLADGTDYITGQILAVDGGSAI